MTSVKMFAATESPIGSLLPGAEDDEPFEAADAKLRRDAVRRALDQLGEPQREILCRRFGVDSRTPQSLEEIGHGLGMSRERVRKLEQQALSRLAQMRELAGLGGEIG